MKTSKRILLTVAGIFIALLITSMLVLRKDAQWVLAQAGYDLYEAAPVGEFTRLDFSDHWSVSIRQGREYKVELLDRELTLPKVKNIDGTLYFESDSSDSGDFRARIVMPFLKGIKAVGGSTVHLKRFESDSLDVILKDSVTFIGEEITVEFIDYQTTGNVRLQWKDNPME